MEEAKTPNNRKLIIKNSNNNLRIVLNSVSREELKYYDTKQTSEYRDQDEYGFHHEYGVIRDIPTLREEAYFVKGFKIYEDTIISFKDVNQEEIEIHLKTNKEDTTKYHVCFCNLNEFAEVLVKSAGDIDILSNEKLMFSFSQIKDSFKDQTITHGKVTYLKTNSSV